MKLSEFIEATKNHPPEAEIVIAGGSAVMRGIENGSLAASDSNTYSAKVWSMSDNTDAVILEL